MFKIVLVFKVVRAVFFSLPSYLVVTKHRAPAGVNTFPPGYLGIIVDAPVPSAYTLGCSFFLQSRNLDWKSGVDRRVLATSKVSSVHRLALKTLRQGKYIEYALRCSPYLVSIISQLVNN